MKQKLILFLLCCLCTLGAAAQGVVQRQKPKPTTTQPATPGKPRQNTQQHTQPVQATPTAYDVTFSCNVAAATMYIDGNNYGTPSGTRTLKTGNHSVRLTAEGYEDHTSTISVSANNRSFSFNMKKKPEPIQTEKTFTANGVSFNMVYVQGGTFTMGATSEQGSDAYDNEKPTHSVTLSSYYIGETEVTQELWEAVMGSNPSNFKGYSLPVERVSWEDCQTFINKLNSLTGQQFHLPTEAQWEYAARGGNKSRGYKYSGNNGLGSVAWHINNSGSKTHPVKSKSPNELGIYDMSGNVWEWCQDWYGDYSNNAQSNPTGPSSGSNRVSRGGGWGGIAGSCRSSNRGSRTPSYRLNNLGLRLAL